MAGPLGSDEPLDRPVRVQGTPAEAFPPRAPEATRGSPRRITVVGEDVLRRRGRLVTEFGTPELQRLVDDMFATLSVADGVGLAAHQVGVDLQLFVFDCTDESDSRHVGHVVNPVLEEEPASSRRLVESEEGCLSVPGPYRSVARLDHAVVRGRDVTGAPVVLEGRGFFARCLQHETDHLAGTLYIDKLKRRARRAVLREMNEQLDDVLAHRAARARELGR